MPGLWNALTPVQKAAWDTFAALGAQELFNSLGVSYFASGWNWFCKCNIRLMRAGRATIVPVPTQARPGAPTIDEFRICEAGADPDMCTGGVVTADAWDPGTPPANAVDDNTATWWQAAPTGFPHWIRYDMPANHVIKKFTITPPLHTATQSPDAFTFQSWTGAAWDTLLTVTVGEPWVIGETRDYYPVTHTPARSDYRLHVTGIQGGGNAVAIAEMTMHVADLDNSVVIYPEDNFVDTPAYDLILHIAPGISIGKQVQYPGFAEIRALQDPARQATNCQDELEAVYGTILEKRAWFARLYRQTQEGIRSTADTARAETI